MNDHPWMTALEMQFAALRFLSLPGASPVELTRLRCAEAFSWSSETTTAVSLASKTIPGTASIGRGSLPSINAWWWFEQSLPLVSDMHGAALLYRVEEDKVRFRLFAITPTEAMLKDFSMLGPWLSWSVNIGETVEAFRERASRESHWNKDPKKGSIRINIELTRFFIGACAWLQQRVVTSSSGHIERHRRRQLEREHHAQIPSDVKVIQLRRTESRSQPSAVGEEAPEWSCRWIVNGHWRNQPYKDKRELIYIMPYVKGPDDKPLKVPTHTVYQVNR